MAKFRTMQMSFWANPFVETLSMEGKLLYVFLITSPYTTNLGVVNITVKKISYETGIPEKKIEQELRGLEESGKVVRDGFLIWIKNFIKNQGSTSPKIISNRQQELETLYAQSKKIYGSIVKKYPILDLGYDIDTISQEDDTLSIPYPYPTDTSRARELELEYELERERELECERELEKEKELECEDTHVSVPQCPQNEIVNLYNEILGDCMPKVKLWGEKRQKTLRNRWKEDATRQTLEWWKNFFELVKSSDFLTGKIKEVHFNLEWLIQDRNMTNIIEGKYSNFKSNKKPSTPSYEELENKIAMNYKF